MEMVWLETAAVCVQSQMSELWAQVARHARATILRPRLATRSAASVATAPAIIDLDPAQFAIRLLCLIGRLTAGQLAEKTPHSTHRCERMPTL